MSEHDPSFSPRDSSLPDPFTPYEDQIYLDDDSVNNTDDAVGNNLMDKVNPFHEVRYNLSEVARGLVDNPQPRIHTSLMRIGDVLMLDYDDSTRDTLQITDKRIDSLSFGSDAILRPQIYMKRRDPNGILLGNEFMFMGSAYSPSGATIQSDTLQVDSYFVTDTGVSGHPIQNFGLQRPDEKGVLKNVLLNQSNTSPESESYSHARLAFTAMEKQLQNVGFSFSDADKYGHARKYTKTKDTMLVGAARQGFGSRITPQDCIYAYDTAAEVLRGIRVILSRGIIQTMVAQDVTTDIFQQVFHGYNETSKADWRYPQLLYAPQVPNLSWYATVYTHSLLDQSQKTPIVTVMKDGDTVGRQVNTTPHSADREIDHLAAIVKRTLKPSLKDKVSGIFRSQRQD